MSTVTLERAITEFNNQDFYACHDTLEEIWMDSVEPDKKFYHGVLQIAVGCYHLGNSNWRGAVILLGEGLRKLIEYEPDYLGVNVDQLTAESHTLLTTLQSIDPETVTDFYQKLLKSQLDTDVAIPVIQTIEDE